MKEILKLLNKKFGEGTIIKASEAEESLKIKKIPTGILTLDFLLEGGFPKSSIITLYGEQSSGKSLISLIFSSQLTNKKENVALIDTEGSYDPDWCKKLKINLDYFFISQPDIYEKVIDIADGLVRSKEFSLVIIDSITSGIPEEEVEKSAFEQQMALQARLNAKLMRKISSALQPSNLKDKSTYNNTTIILIAHIREQVGVLYGNPYTLPGGRAIRHSSSLILFTKSGNLIKKGDKIIGKEIKIKVEKSKISIPHKTGVFDFYFNPPRVDNEKSLILYAIRLGIIKQTGAFYTYKNLKVKGKEELINSLNNQKELLKEMKKEILKLV